LTIVQKIKRNIFLAFVVFLVATSVFQQVDLMFLRVGHTHENIDQMFSCFARQLRKKPAYSLPALVQSIESSYTPQPLVQILESVIDFHSFSEGGLLKQWRTRDWHALRVFRAPEGTIVGEYKQWMSDPDWLSPPDNVMLDKKEWKPGHLSFVSPYPLDVKEIQSMIDNPKLKKRLLVAQSGHTPPISWWRAFLS
jgi:hypothetical protein